MRTFNFFDKNNNLIKKKLFNDKKENNKILKEMGFFVVRSVFDNKTLEKYTTKFLAEVSKKKLNKTKNHLVEFKIDKINLFKKIYKEPKLKKIVKNFFGGNVGSDYFRIVKKDKLNSEPVFCHQDAGYQFGSFDRYSLFISLTKNDKTNGGMIVYPFTHKFGYLGDAGEISNEVTKKFNKICPVLDVGDILIMHSSLWHESEKNYSKMNRIYLEIHIQNLEEPSTKYKITGKRKKNMNIPFEKEKIFSNSRVQRIIKLKNKIDRLEKRK